MTCPQISLLERGIQKIQKQLSRQKALILMYHRVAEVKIDPWQLCVTPANFAEQLQVLRSKMYPMKLQDLVQKYQEGNLPQRAVALTFDDGYADNLYYAKPLLEHYGIPATIFVATGCIGRNQEFWWDELERLLLQPRSLPEALSLNINGHPYHWKLGALAKYNEKDFQHSCTRRVWQARPDSRLFFYHSVWQQLRSLTEENRLIQLQKIRMWAGVEATTRATHRTLCQQEVVELGHSDFIEIGAHTVTHSSLSDQSLLQQQLEIQQSKATLEAILNRPVTSFSYPFGSYTSKTTKLVQAAGFECACSTVPESLWKESNRFEFPRIAVGSWNRKEFLKQLKRHFND